MTTSQQPWSIELIQSLGTTATRLKDSSGTVIALFNRYEDAEYVLQVFNSLTAKEEQFEIELDARDEEVERLKDELYELKAKVERVKEELT